MAKTVPQNSKSRWISVLIFAGIVLVAVSACGRTIAATGNKPNPTSTHNVTSGSGSAPKTPSTDISQYRNSPADATVGGLQIHTQNGLDCGGLYPSLPNPNRSYTNSAIAAIGQYTQAYFESKLSSTGQSQSLPPLPPDLTLVTGISGAYATCGDDYQVTNTSSSPIGILSLGATLTQAPAHNPMVYNFVDSCSPEFGPQPAYCVPIGSGPGACGYEIVSPIALGQVPVGARNAQQIAVYPADIPGCPLPLVLQPHASADIGDFITCPTDSVCHITRDIQIQTSSGATQIVQLPSSFDAVAVTAPSQIPCFQAHGSGFTLEPPNYRYDGTNGSTLDAVAQCD